MKQKYIIANLVYNMQTPYPDLWLVNQLKSLCDASNLPALQAQYDVEYALFTDEPTLSHLTKHPNFTQLTRWCPVNTVLLQWPADADQFASRYGLLAQMLRAVIPEAIEKNAILSTWVADLVVAKGALPKILGHIERGHDAVFMVPIRAAADSANAALAALPGAPTDLELFEIAYRNLHHLWVASQWNAPQFTRMPYSMLWNSYSGLVAHNLGVTPIAFRPNERMRNVQGGIDSDLPSMCANPYWATDWTDAPVAGIEPLSNGHYPPFQQGAASIEGVVSWALHGNGGKPCIYASQANYLSEPLFYPSEKIFNEPDLAERAADVAGRIKGLLMLGRK